MDADAAPLLLILVLVVASPIVVVAVVVGGKRAYNELWARNGLIRRLG